MFSSVSICSPSLVCCSIRSMVRLHNHKSCHLVACCLVRPPLHHRAYSALQPLHQAASFLLVHSWSYCAINFLPSAVRLMNTLRRSFLSRLRLTRLSFSSLSTVVVIDPVDRWGLDICEDVILPSCSISSTSACRTLSLFCIIFIAFILVCW